MSEFGYMGREITKKGSEGKEWGGVGRWVEMTEGGVR